MALAPRRAALLAGLAAASALLAGCNGPTTSPVAAIPKLVVDVADNVTTITITSVNADVRYGNISVRLANDNLSTPLAYRESKGYALVAHTNLTFFTVNATADESVKVYYYNATWHIVEAPERDAQGQPVYQIYIRETANGPIQRESVPYRHVLAEGTR